MWNSNMDDWLAGKWEDCWKHACELESRRKTKKSKGKSKANHKIDNKQEKNAEELRN